MTEMKVTLTVRAVENGFIATSESKEWIAADAATLQTVVTSWAQDAATEVSTWAAAPPAPEPAVEPAATAAA